MPPFIGQGLNSGFRDAAALGWRLPLLLNGLAKDEKLLASYQSERLDHVVKLTVSVQN
jgi:2-polyprenyl-6-methoxyphenol hydroxylase-like FAD-dependent oxidoreductase